MSKQKKSTTSGRTERERQSLADFARRVFVRKGLKEVEPSSRSVLTTRAESARGVGTALITALLTFTTTILTRKTLELDIRDELNLTKRSWLNWTSVRYFVLTATEKNTQEYSKQKRE